MYIVNVSITCPKELIRLYVSIQAENFKFYYLLTGKTLLDLKLTSFKKATEQEIPLQKCQFLPTFKKKLRWTSQNGNFHNKKSHLVKLVHLVV